jgi:cytochrome d ubiquinol oxidase subunit I
MDPEILARIQFAFTAAFHYLFPPLSIGLGVCLVIMEAIWLKTGNILYHNMARYWTRVFALTFAIGVASGIVLEFEFGTNWATYSRFVGDIFGSALAAEGIFAFFLESGFLAILLFGWNKVGPKMHFFSTCMVCAGAHFSAVWIVVANSWMQTPAGFHLERTVDGVATKLPPGYIIQPEDFGSVRAVVDNFWAMVFNPSSMERLSHVLMGCWMAGAFLVVSVSAYYLLRNRHVEFARASMKVGLIVASFATIMQLVTGSISASGVTVNQPVKLAAMEGVFETKEYTPMAIIGYVDMQTEETVALKIPGLLSFLANNNFKEPVTGLKDLPSDEFLQARYPDATAEELPGIRRNYWPNVPVVFQMYHLMISIGMAMIGLIAVALFMWWKGWLFRTDLWISRAMLVVLIFSVLGPQIANQAGWFTAEMGRQPWVVYDMLKTSEGISQVVTANQIVASIVMFLFVYSLLFLVFIYLLNRKIQHGPDEEEESQEMPESWRLLAERKQSARL